MRHSKIQDRALGKWRDILLGVGLPSSALKATHGPCPICGGKDRWRWDDKNGSGSFYCSHCGAGGGVDCVMKFLKCDFISAKMEIEKYIGSASVHVPKAAVDGDMQSRMVAAWQRAQPLTANDPAGLYLARRGVDVAPWPTQLRYAAEAAYKHDDGSKSFHPAMVAKFVSPDGAAFTLHRTYLDSAGRKGRVKEIRKLAPGKVPPGGSVRLAASAETMGVAEGIETALAASILFRVPVWASLTAGLMQKWVPPSTAKHIIVFGDNDLSFTGQCAAFGLAYRLKGEGFGVDVKIPDEAGTDWQDEICAQQGKVDTSAANERQENHEHEDQRDFIEF